MNFINSADLTLKNNTCHDTGAGGGNGEGFYLVDVRNVRVMGNTFTRLYDEGVNCKGNTIGLTIQENHFYDFFGPRPEKNRISLLSWLIPSAMAGQTPSEDTAINCRHSGTQDVIVERNLIENMPNTGVRMHRVRNAIVRNNTIKNCKVGIDFGQGTTGEINNNRMSGNRKDYLLGNTSVRAQ
jgi:parallel beta-helix repeat protein